MVHQIRKSNGDLYWKWKYKVLKSTQNYSRREKIEQIEINVY